MYGLMEIEEGEVTLETSTTVDSKRADKKNRARQLNVHNFSIVSACLCKWWYIDNSCCLLRRMWSSSTDMEDDFHGEVVAVGYDKKNKMWLINNDESFAERRCWKGKTLRHHDSKNGKTQGGG